MAHRSSQQRRDGDQSGRRRWISRRLRLDGIRRAALMLPGTGEVQEGSGAACAPRPTHVAIAAALPNRGALADARFLPQLRPRQSLRHWAAGHLRTFLQF